MATELITITETQVDILKAGGIIHFNFHFFTQLFFFNSCWY